MDDMVFECQDCRKIVPKKGTDKNPKCCGREMKLKPLEECSKDQAFAEHARFTDDDEPCDDGRAG